MAVVGAAAVVLGVLTALSTIVVAEPANLTTDCVQRNTRDIGDILDVWRTARMREKWDGQLLDISNQRCAKDMVQFLQGLKERDAWAVKMDDASGRYSGGLFFGNSYFLGSASLCQDISSMHAHGFRVNRTIEGQAKIVRTFEFRTLVKEDPFELLSVPPYKLGFHVVAVKVDIDECQIKDLALLSLGLCLPDSCGEEDVLSIIRKSTEHSAKKSDSLRITVLKDRKIDPDYFAWDGTVLFLCSLTGLLLLMVIVGTAVEIISGLSSESASEISTIVKDCNRNSYKTSPSKIVKHGASRLIEVLICFSLKHNSKKIFTLDVGSDTLSPIHGLKFLTMLWVVLIHTCLIVYRIVDNTEFRTRAENDVLYQTLSSGSLSVDTFFLLSGVLVSFLFSRTTTKYSMEKLVSKEGKSGYILLFFGMILYRFLRLTLPYLVAAMFTGAFMELQTHRSVFELPTRDSINCKQFLWRNILYVNTFYPSSEMCMTWSWYLSNDTQFYIIGTLLLLIATNRPKCSALIGSFLMAAGLVTTAVLAIYNNHSPSVRDPFANYESLYDKPWIRIGPYILGIGLGSVLARKDCKLSIGKVSQCFGWALSFVISTLLVYGVRFVSNDRALSAIYVSLSHTLWAMCVGYVLVACVCGYGGCVNKVLSWKYFFPMSRLTYVVYLIHPIIIREMILSMDSPLNMTRGMMITIFHGVLTMSFLAGLVFTLVFEAPIVSLLALGHPLRRKSED